MEYPHIVRRDCVTVPLNDVGTLWYITGLCVYILCLSWSNSVVWFRDAYLLKEQGITKKLEIIRCDQGPNLFIHLISQEWGKKDRLLIDWWLIDWLIDWLMIDWLIDWLLDWCLTPYRHYISHLTAGISNKKKTKTKKQEKQQKRTNNEKLRIKYILIRTPYLY